MDSTQNIIYFGVALLIIAGIYFCLSYFVIPSLNDQTTSIVPQNNAQNIEENEIPPTATGDIDKTTDAFLRAASVEAAMAENESVERSLFDSDGQAIRDFGQIYDEREF